MKHAVVVVVLLMLVSSLVTLVPTVSANTGCQGTNDSFGTLYTAGDCTITANTNWGNGTYTIRGNITINSGVKLSLWNMVIKFDALANNQRRILSNGGQLVVRYGGLTTNNTAYNWTITTNTASTNRLDFAYTNVSYAGTGTLLGQSGGCGILIQGGQTMTFRNSNFSYDSRVGGGNYAGIFCVLDSSATALNLTIRDNAIWRSGMIFEPQVTPNSYDYYSFSAWIHNNTYKNPNATSTQAIFPWVHTNVTNNQFDFRSGTSVTAIVTSEGSGGGAGAQITGNNFTYNAGSSVRCISILSSSGTGWYIGNNTCTNGAVYPGHKAKVFWNNITTAYTNSIPLSINGERSTVAFNTLWDCQSAGNGCIQVTTGNNTIGHNTVWLNAQSAGNHGILNMYEALTAASQWYNNVSHNQLRVYNSLGGSTNIFGIYFQQGSTMHARFDNNTISDYGTWSVNNLYGIEKEDTNSLRYSTFDNNTVHHIGTVPWARGYDAASYPSAPEYNVFKYNFFDSAMGVFVRDSNVTFHHNTLDNLTTTPTLCGGSSVSGCGSSVSSVLMYGNTLTFSSGSDYLRSSNPGIFNSTALIHTAQTQWLDGASTHHTVYGSPRWLWFSNISADSAKWTNGTSQTCMQLATAYGSFSDCQSTNATGTQSFSIAGTKAIDHHGDTNQADDKQVTTVFRLGKDNSTATLVTAGTATLWLNLTGAYASSTYQAKIWNYSGSAYENANFYTTAGGVGSYSRVMSGWYNITLRFVNSTAGSPTPTVSTNAATNIGTTTATLNGELSNMGDSWTSDRVGFLYGTSPTLSGATNVTAAESPMAAPGSFHKDVTSLPTGSTIYFAAWAIGSNSGGATGPYAQGSTLSFQTGSPNSGCPGTDNNFGTQYSAGACTVTSNTVWGNGTYTILGSITINSGLTLFLYNMVLKMDATADQQRSITSNGGHFVVRYGTMTTNNTLYNWRILTNSASTNQLDFAHTNISYIGGASTIGLNIVGGSSVSVSYVNISSSGIGSTNNIATIASTDSSSTTLTLSVSNSTFYNTGPVWIPVNSPSAFTYTFRDNTIKAYNTGGSTQGHIFYAANGNFINNTFLSLPATQAQALYASSGGSHPTYNYHWAHNHITYSAQSATYAIGIYGGSGYDVNNNSVVNANVYLHGSYDRFFYNNLSWSPGTQVDLHEHHIDSSEQAGLVIAYNTLWNCVVFGDSCILTYHAIGTVITHNSIYASAQGNNAMGIEDYQSDSSVITFNLIQWLGITSNGWAIALDNEYLNTLHGGSTKINNNTMSLRPGGTFNSPVGNCLQAGGATNTVYENNTCYGKTTTATPLIAFGVYEYIGASVNVTIQYNHFYDLQYAGIWQSGGVLVRYNDWHNITTAGLWLCGTGSCAGDTISAAIKAYGNTFTMTGTNIPLTRMVPPTDYLNNNVVARGTGFTRWYQGSSYHTFYGSWLWFTSATASSVSWANQTNGNRCLTVVTSVGTFPDCQSIGASGTTAASVFGSIDQHGSSNYLDNKQMTALFRLGRDNVTYDLQSAGAARMYLNFTSLYTSALYSIKVWNYSSGSYLVNTQFTSSAGGFESYVRSMSGMYNVTIAWISGGGGGSIPPSVSTNSASGITVSTATLNGFLNSLGSASSVTVGFAWGTQTSPPFTHNDTITTLSSPAAFTDPLTGLVADTTYHFQAWANGAGFATGSILSFTTQSGDVTVLYLVMNDANCVLTQISTNQNCWSLSSGGAGGAGLPTTSTALFMNGASGSGVGTLNGNINALSVDTTGFTGTIAVGTYLFETLHGFNLAGGHVTMGTSATYGLFVGTTLNITGNSYIQCTGACDVLVNGAFTVSPSSAYIILGSGVWTLNGTVTIDSTSSFWSAGTGKIVLGQSGTQTIGGTGTKLYFPMLILAGGDKVFTASFSSMTVYSNGSARTVTLTAGITWTVGAMSFNGASGAVLTLQSSSSSPWFLDPASGDNSTQAHYVTVSHSLSTAFVNATDGTCSNAGGNVNWLFTSSTPPTATSSAATSITTSSATLHGTLTSLGSASSCTVGFLLGISPTLVGAANYTVATMTGTGPFSLVASVGANLTYYFRAWARSTAGFGTGSILSFATPQVAPSSTTDAADSITNVSAVLHGRVSLGGYSSVIIGFLWGTSPTLVGATNDTIGQVSVSGSYNLPISGLVNGTPYYFEFWVAWSPTSFTHGVIQSFTAANAPAPGPSPLPDLPGVSVDVVLALQLTLVVIISFGALLVIGSALGRRHGGGAASEDSRPRTERGEATWEPTDTGDEGRVFLRGRE
jgi:hypothetical protein